MPVRNLHAKIIGFFSVFTTGVCELDNKRNVACLTAQLIPASYTKGANVRGESIMAQSNNNDTSNRGLGSDKMPQKEKDRIHSEGGKASAKSDKGAAGSTDAARRGGENSHKND